MIFTNGYLFNLILLSKNIIVEAIIGKRLMYKGDRIHNTSFEEN